jgi:transposase-like protein
MRKRVTFSKEFKIEAVTLLDLGKKSVVEPAFEFGVGGNQLYKWKEQLSKKKERPSAVQAVKIGVTSDANPCVIAGCNSLG